MTYTLTPTQHTRINTQTAELAVDAVLRLKGSSNLDHIQITKKPGTHLRTQFLPVVCVFGVSCHDPVRSVGRAGSPRTEIITLPTKQQNTQTHNHPPKSAIYQAARSRTPSSPRASSSTRRSASGRYVCMLLRLLLDCILCVRLCVLLSVWS